MKVPQELPGMICLQPAAEPTVLRLNDSSVHRMVSSAGTARCGMTSGRDHRGVRCRVANRRSLAGNETVVSVARLDRSSEVNPGKAIRSPGGQVSPPRRPVP